MKDYSKYSIEELLKIRNLYELSLIEKWNFKEENNHEIDDLCHFCRNCQLGCSDCLVDESICMLVKISYHRNNVTKKLPKLVGIIHNSKYLNSFSDKVIYNPIITTKVIAVMKKNLKAIDNELRLQKNYW